VYPIYPAVSKSSYACLSTAILTTIKTGKKTMKSTNPTMGAHEGRFQFSGGGSDTARLARAWPRLAWFENMMGWLEN